MLPPAEQLEGTNDFLGLPVPAAAGMVASLVLVIVSLEIPTFDSRSLALLIPPFMLAIAYLMVSNIQYPSFKGFGWQTQTKVRNFIGLILGLGIAFFFKEFFFALLFFTYIAFGPIRHVIKACKLKKASRTNCE